MLDNVSLAGASVTGNSMSMGGHGWGWGEQTWAASLR